MAYNPYNQPSPPPPPPPQYQYHQGYAAAYYPAVEPAKGISVAALVCGIVGCVVGLVPLMFVATLALALVAVVLGCVAWVQRGKARVKRTLAAWGIALGAIALVLGVVGMVVVSNAFAELDRDLEQIDTNFGT